MANDPLLERILQDIQSDEPAKVDEALLLAGFLFEKVSLSLGSWAPDGGERLGWPRCVARSNLGAEDLLQLKAALIAFVGARTDEDQALGALWALSKHPADAVIRDLFRVM